MKVVFSGAADRDLEDIRRYTLEVAPRNVLQYIDAIVDSCEAIGAAPLRYPIVPSRRSEAFVVADTRRT